MEPQHGSALMLATILVICFMLLSCLPEPPTRPTLVKRTTTKQIQELEAAADDPSSVLNNLEKKQRLLETLRTSCLPKLVCQLLASTDRKLSRSETSLLSLIKDTSLGVTAEVTSRLHFAAHMGQLVAGVDGAGCHNFYPECPLPGSAVLPLLATVRSRGFGNGLAS